MAVRIEAPHFVAAVELTDDSVTRAAPILAYTLGWNPARVIGYARRHGWVVMNI